MSPIRRVLLAGLILILASAAVSAGFWQLRRLHARRLANAAVLAGRDLPPIDLRDALAQHVPIDGRRVSVRGHFLIHKQLLLRGRVQVDVPGLHVVTPFVLDGTTQSLWILRGYVPSPDATTPPANIPAPTDSTVTISGLMLPIPVTTDAGQPLDNKGDSTWRRLDSLTLAQRIPGSLAFYLHLDGPDDGPGRLRVVPPPTMDEGPHMSYAIQWFGIATAMVMFGGIFLTRQTVKAPEGPDATSV